MQSDHQYQNPDSTWRMPDLMKEDDCDAAGKKTMSCEKEGTSRTSDLQKANTSLSILER